MNALAAAPILAHNAAMIVRLCLLVLVAFAHDLPAQARDSAGVSIIDNAQPLWTAATTLRLSAAPTVVIGNQGGEAYELAQVGGAIRLADGTIVVADGITRQLRFFDATGRHLQSVGGRGQGPGEFRELRTIRTLAGDTIAAGDGLRSYSFFTSSGTFVRAGSPPPMPGGPVGGIPIQLAVLDNQSTVTTRIRNPTPRPGSTRWIDSIPLTIVDRAATQTIALGTHPYSPIEMHNGTPYLVRFNDGTQVTTDGKAIFVGYGDSYAIRAYSAAGRLERIIRRRWIPTRVTSAEIDRYAEAWGRRWIRATGAEYDRELREFRAVPFAELVPAFSQLIADRTGRLWVREARIADASATGALGMMPSVPSTWNVFDAEGRWLGNVTTPAGFQVHEFGADYVLGVARGTDGVEMVVMYSLGPGDASSASHAGNLEASPRRERRRSNRTESGIVRNRADEQRLIKHIVDPFHLAQAGVGHELEHIAD